MNLKVSFQSLAMLVVVLIAGGLGGCSNGGRDADDAAPKKESSTKAGVTLDSQTQQKLGLVITNPAAAEWKPEITAYGRVLDPIPLSDLLTDLQRSELALKLAQQEFDRVKLLKSGNNISLKAYQEAEGNDLQAATEVSAARRRVESVWGKRIADMTGVSAADGERTNATFFQQLGDSVALIRADLPVGIRWQDNDRAVRIVSLVENAPALVGTNFDELPAMDPQTQQQPVLVAATESVTNRLTPGEAVTVYLRAGGGAEQGVSIPEQAVVRYEGKGWVYTETETNQFARREVTLERQLNAAYFVGDQLSVTNRIILTGAQSVLSAELGGGFTTGERD
jgi:hypothetical protein